MDDENAGLTRALSLSEQILAAVEGANPGSVASLDAERMRLLKSFELGHRQVAEAQRALLEQIMALNGRAVGLLEHRKRCKGRELDMAAVGKRAVAAYANAQTRR